MASPAMQRAMDEGRRALEAEMAAAKARRSAREDEMEQWAARIAAEDLDMLPASDDAIEARRAGEVRRLVARRRQLDDGAVEVTLSAKRLDEPTVLDPAPPAPPPPEPVWTAKAQRAVPPADPDDPFSVGSVVEGEVRLWQDKNEYRLTVVEYGQEEAIWTGFDREGWGARLAGRRVRIDKDADYMPIHQLPKIHPAETKRQQAKDKALASREPWRYLGRGRQVYRDRDVCTGEFTTYSDGVNTWAP